MNWLCRIFLTLSFVAFLTLGFFSIRDSSRQIPDSKWIKCYWCCSNAWDNGSENCTISNTFISEINGQKMVSKYIYNQCNQANQFEPDVTYWCSYLAENEPPYRKGFYGVVTEQPMVMQSPFGLGIAIFMIGIVVLMFISYLVVDYTQYRNKRQQEFLLQYPHPPLNSEYSGY